MYVCMCPSCLGMCDDVTLECRGITLAGLRNSEYPIIHRVQGVRRQRERSREDGCDEPSGLGVPES